MNIFITFIQILFKIIGYIPVYIYNLLYSRFYTRWTYYMVADRLDKRKNKLESILDVGIGTGHPMKQIYHRIPKDTKIVGIDIDRNYLRYALKTFKKCPNVEIREQNFFDLANTNEQYDVIIFSSSFMIMPDRQRALDIAKMRLKKDGSIFFLLTLESTKLTYSVKFLQFIKPYLKYFTTIEFGTISYEDDFDLMLKQNGMNTIYKEQVAVKSIFLYIFRMFVIEARQL